MVTKTLLETIFPSVIVENFDIVSIQHYPKEAMLYIFISVGVSGLTRRPMRYLQSHILLLLKEHRSPRNLWLFLKKRIESTVLSIKTIGKLYIVDGDLLARQYKRHISGFEDWELCDTAEEYVLFPENIVTHLSIDETCLSYDELYTIVTNKAFKGKKGSLVAMVKGTKAEVVIGVLRKISAGKRPLVKEETLDLSLSMQLIVKRSFPCTIQVSDRFHMQKLLGEALEEIRIKYRWEAIETENERIKLVRSQKRQYIPKTYENGETRRQLLARSKHLLQMHCSKWTEVQQKRGDISNLCRYIT